MFHQSAIEELFSVLFVIFFFFISMVSRGETYFIATNGDDSNEGIIDSPFGTFSHAIDIAQPGDTIFVRGGLYLLDSTVRVDKPAASGARICLWAYENEEPVLDFRNNSRHDNPPQPRDDDSIEGTSDALGIFMAPGSDWWHIKGLTIQDAPYYGIRVYGSNNIFERLVLRDNQASGLEITGKEGHAPGNNLVKDCDSYLNFDPQTNGEDADGFAAKFETLGPGNVFSGLRAYSNSDDGYDFWHATNPVLIENCWSFDNGFFRPEWQEEVNGSWRGDGLGFKLGQDASELTLNHNVAFGNKAYGIDANGNNSSGGVVINNATLVNNAKNGNPVQIQLNDGSPHTVRNTIAFDVDGDDNTIISPEVDDAFNTWNGIGVSAGDFVSINMDDLYEDATAPRNADGSLPEIGLQLDPSSPLIDAGIDVGLPYFGPAPDLGAFEVGLTGLWDTGNPSAENIITLKTSPNPFTNNTVISFELDYSAVADLNIYNLYGEEIRCLSSAWFAAGSHSIMWDCTDGEGKKVKEGMYLIALTTKRAQQTVKVVKIKVN